MEKMMLKNLFAAGIALSLFSSVMVYSNSTSFSFLNNETGARAAVLGYGFVANPSDFSAALWNPSGLSMREDPEIGLIHDFDAYGKSFDFLNYNRKFKTLGWLGAGIIYQHEKFLLTDTAGETAGDYLRSSDFALIFSYSQNWKKIRYGANLKLLTSILHDYQAYGIACDLGASADFFKKRISTGISVMNIGPQVSFISEKEYLPLSVLAGISGILFQNRVHKVSAYFGAKQVIYSELKVTMGYEEMINNMWSIRLGMRLNHEQEWFTCGFGLDLKRLTLEYGVIPRSDLGSIHQIGFSFRLE